MLGVMKIKGWEGSGFSFPRWWILTHVFSLLVCYCVTVLLYICRAPDHCSVNDVSTISFLSSSAERSKKSSLFTQVLNTDHCVFVHAYLQHIQSSPCFVFISLPISHFHLAKPSPSATLKSQAMSSLLSFHFVVITFSIYSQRLWDAVGGHLGSSAMTLTVVDDFESLLLTIVISDWLLMILSRHLNDCLVLSVTNDHLHNDHHQSSLIVKFTQTFTEDH